MKDSFGDAKNRKKDSVLVSVIVPCYNAEKYLKSCVDSIINQTYKNLEIILVNDCSKDNTEAILSEYTKKDRRIKVVNNIQNSGASKSRENGYNNSNGDWICFVDSDDALSPRAIEKWISQVDEETDIIAGKFISVKEQEFENYVWDGNNDSKVFVLDHHEIMEYLGRWMEIDVSVATWGKLYRRDLFEKANTFQYKDTLPQMYFEDTMLLPALCVASRRMKIVNQYLYLYRLVENSLSHENGSGKVARTIQQLKASDIVLQWYEPNGAYVHAIELELLQSIKVWYLVGKYYGKNSEYIKYAQDIFNKWYKQYKALDGPKKVTARIVITLFRLNKELCRILICELWFGRIGFLLNGIKEY